MLWMNLPPRAQLLDAEPDHAVSAPALEPVLGVEPKAKDKSSLKVKPVSKANPVAKTEPISKAETFPGSDVVSNKKPIPDVEPIFKVDPVLRANSGSKSKPVAKVDSRQPRTISKIKPITDIESISPAEASLKIKPILSNHHIQDAKHNPTSSMHSPPTLYWLPTQKKRPSRPSYSFGSGKQVVPRMSMVLKNVHDTLVGSTLNPQPQPYHIYFHMPPPTKRRRREPARLPPSPPPLDDPVEPVFNAFADRLWKLMLQTLIFSLKVLVMLICIIMIEFYITYAVAVGYIYAVAILEPFRPQLAVAFTWIRPVLLCSFALWCIWMFRVCWYSPSSSSSSSSRRLQSSALSPSFFTIFAD
ncbi:hypothetical protein BKA64DRAFT_707396 [Cadophora sp. MPI-SDFR-AT-0126]|nr:hypothetical protein BKA64DRAFT_707396 [Leotiomycetes sp. MPI-SDFR-AT-0126]